MNNLKFELKESGIVKEREIKVYENKYYILDFDGSLARVSRKDWNLKYIPDISIYQEWKTSEVKEVTIQTTSYGSLGVEDIEKVIEGLQIAKESAQEVEKLLKELNLMK